jgi:hypothetical protein
MTAMLGKLFLTRRGTLVINSLAAVVGIILVIGIDAPRDGTIIFLAVTAFESGTFSLIYGLRSAWWREPAARAIFWVVLAYFALASLLLLGFLRPYRYSWFDDLRELLYLGLSIAGLNLVLVLTRVLGRGIFSRR